MLASRQLDSLFHDCVSVWLSLVRCNASPQFDSLYQAVAPSRLSSPSRHILIRLNPLILYPLDRYAFIPLSVHTLIPLYSYALRYPYILIHSYTLLLLYPYILPPSLRPLDPLTPRPSLKKISKLLLSASNNEMLGII